MEKASRPSRGGFQIEQRYLLDMWSNTLAPCVCACVYVCFSQSPHYREWCIIYDISNHYTCLPTQTNVSLEEICPLISLFLWIFIYNFNEWIVNGQQMSLSLSLQSPAMSIFSRSVFPTGTLSQAFKFHISDICRTERRPKRRVCAQQCHRSVHQRWHAPELVYGDRRHQGHGDRNEKLQHFPSGDREARRREREDFKNPLLHCPSVLL